MLDCVEDHKVLRIDAGAVGPTWIRTGKSFPVIVGPGCRIASEDGLHWVYRFAGEPNVVRTPISSR